MSTLKLWPITIEHPVTHERIKCIGQGHTVIEALNDAAKAIGTPFRPKSDGKTGHETKVAVILTGGLPAVRTLKDFEAGITE